MLNGKVTDAEFAYQRITYVRPTEHYYGKGGEQSYVKYGCPVCELLGNKHQVTFGSDNCPLCNVNLLWEQDYSTTERLSMTVLYVGGMDFYDGLTTGEAYEVVDENETQYVVINDANDKSTIQKTKFEVLN
ncbi:hypothetical protein D3C74_410500 [compost metagenome]